MLGALFFPAGIFLVMGRARLLTWPRAAMFAAAAFLSNALFVQIWTDLDLSRASEVSRALAMTGGIVMYCAWGHTTYQIGQRVDYWSPGSLRGWRVVGWFALFMLSMSVLDIVLAILAPMNGKA